jgi:KUP system potassium uptake protein
VIGALGIVYGDIGTSPLYTMKLCLQNLGERPGQAEVFGILSLMFWALMIVVTFKYVTLILRSDNMGEGGIMALLALVLRQVPRQFRYGKQVLTVGILGVAFFFADAAITPAISVLSAVEGLEVSTPVFTPVVLPISVAILVGLFAFQRRGTARVGALFGPIMLVWFAVLGVLGIRSIMETPHVLLALSPHYAADFLAAHGLRGFFLLGSVVLAVTGAEALYADMGHFGRTPIRLAWLGLVLPSLVLNYFGQGALVLRAHDTAHNPFYLLAPDVAILPLVLLSTAATVIASQAVISGAYSLGRQAIQLGFLPRFQALHTSEQTPGQIYVPRVNWVMFAVVVMLVAIFHTSSALAGAYGVSVTGAMLATTILAYILRVNARSRPMLHPVYIFVPLMFVDAAFFVASLSKIGGGGIIPLTLGLVLFACMTTWRTGRAELSRKLRQNLVPLEDFIASMSRSSVLRVAGTAVFLTADADVVPHSLLHNLKHNKVLHERVALLTLSTENEPHIPLAERITVEDLGAGFYRLRARLGFMEVPDVMALLRLAEAKGFKTVPMETSFFFGRQTIVPALHSRMSRWRERLFIALTHSAQSASDYFRLPSDRVVELGTQVEL